MIARIPYGWAVSAVLAFLPASAFAADTVQGNWEGTWKNDGKKGSGGELFAKVVGLGKDTYRGVFTAHCNRVAVYEIALNGRRDGDKVTFAGDVDLGTDSGGVFKWTGEIQDGKFTGHYTSSHDIGGFTLARVTKAPPSLGEKPPAGAIVLFDGRDLSAWQTGDGKPANYPIVDGAMEATGTLIRTKQEFTDYRLHLEFRCPYEPGQRGQGRGNNGVWLQGRSQIEIQILDSFGLKPAKNECGALYNQQAPSVTASLPPLEWQTYDITLTAARFDDEGKATKKARVTVIQNGTKIIDDFEATGGVRSGPILLHYHRNPVRFRNIWLVPRSEKT